MKLSLKRTFDLQQQIYDEDEITNKTITKVTRRGSVKEMSQKFIENAGKIEFNTYQFIQLIWRIL